MGIYYGFTGHLLLTSEKVLIKAHKLKA